MFAIATMSILAGGPLTVLFYRLVWPDVVRGDLVWRVLGTVAGDWIGGGANMLAMREIFNPCQPTGDPPSNPCDLDPSIEGDFATLFGQVLTIDIFLSNVWLASMVYVAKSKLDQMDGWLGGDASGEKENVLFAPFYTQKAYIYQDRLDTNRGNTQEKCVFFAVINDLRTRLSAVALASQRVASFTDFATMGGVGFATMGAASLASLYVAPWLLRVAPWTEQVSLTSRFFWLVVISTLAGLVYSGTALRSLDGAGAAKIGTLLLYILICSIGMQMNIADAFANPRIMLVVTTWLLFHAVVLFAFGKLVKTPFFFLAAGSMANIGGAITAPIVCAAFDPALAVVGVLLGVLGYALGTFGGFTCGLLMSFAAPGTEVEAPA